jgi:hypothetical protein
MNRILLKTSFKSFVTESLAERLPKETKESHPAEYVTGGLIQFGFHEELPPETDYRRIKSETLGDVVEIGIHFN